MAVIDRLEDHLNLMLMYGQKVRGDLRVTKSSKLIALVLMECGVKEEDPKVSLQEEVYINAIQGGTTSAKKLVKVSGQILDCIFPETKKKSKPSKPKQKTIKK
jgi:hypothetical protein